LVGDVMVDALEYNLKIAEKKSGIIEELALEKGKYLVITVHRPGNTDSRENMTNIIEALGETGGVVVFPVHPRTEKYLREYGLLMPENVKLIKPLGYLDMLKLMASAKKILTDSGGIQKEAYVLGVPCITLRENTEWVETLEGGWNVLVGADKGRIIGTVQKPVPTSIQQNMCAGESASNKILNVFDNIE
ncbi:MAG: UDP-N-acetylglucosamine 2-epimerase, partial [Candidatus Methanoperedens sp.]|nr:UDP-N-acetylglucosamine 2-epimerase [Candidatus Methanoperedens sp.]